MPALAFVVNKHNLNSIAALTGALEADPRTRTLPLHFLWQDGRLHLLHAPLVGRSVEISEVPLADRIPGIGGQDGIMVARLRDDG